MTRADGSAVPDYAGMMRLDGRVALVADARERADVERVVAETTSAFGRLDAVVDIVGMASWSGVLDVSDDDWDWTFGMVLRHAQLVTQIAGREIVDGGGGTMVFIASVSGLSSAPDHAAYGAAKAAPYMATAGSLSPPSP